MYGHLAHACPRNSVERALATASTPVTKPHEITGDRGMVTEFTQVRPARRRPEQQNGGGGSMRNNEGRDMRGAKIIAGSRVREARNGSAVEIIKVSNRFGGLGEEGETEKLEEEVGRDGANKENENTINLSLRGSSRMFGKDVSFAAKEGNDKHMSIKVGQKDKKAGNLRGPNPFKFKSRNVGPTRGLVFGPTRGEIGLSMSGKRLRVENECVGRPGGAFAGVGEI